MLCTGLGFRDPGRGVRFVVPPEGTIARPRLLCIPPYAPDPVSAHAWLNHALDPLTAARDTIRTGRATPVGEAAFALPPALLANPAVFPPALPPVTLGFAEHHGRGARGSRGHLARHDRPAPRAAEATGRIGTPIRQSRRPRASRKVGTPQGEGAG